ncbi:MAG: phosphatase PAP2 family protein [Bacillota bacterium]|jgi:membrane-associated phospholipid phosphatase|nr:phosphatase PAP2 family protein [Bacillota bacterium]
MRRAACVAITVILAIMACCQPAAASEDLGLGLASAATQLGGAGAAAVAFLVGMASDPALGEDLLNATVITGALVGVGKVLLGRARPFVPGADGGFTGFSLDDAYHSMPSGHTANAFAMATVLARHRPRWAPAAYLAAVAVGLSRIALGVHWPSDVMVGATLGTLIGSAVVDGRLCLFEIDGIAPRI